MNSFDIVFSEMRKSGMAVDIKRKGDDGVMVDAREHELASLGTKSTVASTAGLLKKLPPHERLAWAIETKDEANVFYKERKFKEAMGKYVECLAATDFGTKNEGDNEETSAGGNVEVLVIPVLCNLAACCIEVEEWNKAVSFSEQAIILRPECCKAQLRKGLGLMHLGEYELALSCFTIVQNIAIVPQSVEVTDAEHDGGHAEDTTVSLKALSAHDFARLPACINQSKRGLQQQRQQLKRQRESLAKAFAKNSMPARSTIIESDDEDDEDRPIRNSEKELSLAAKKDSLAKREIEKVELMSFSEFLICTLNYLIEYILSWFKMKKE